MNVGIRELKNSLSRYLERVRNGETITVTDRGKPVAKLIPAGLPEHIGELLSEGRISWAGRKSKVPEPIRVDEGPPLSEYISEERR